MALVPQVWRRGRFDPWSAARDLAIPVSAVVSLVLAATTFLPRQYSTRLTAEPLATEFAQFKALTLRTVETACSSAPLVVLAPSDVVSVDLAGQLEHLPCEVVRPTVVTPLAAAEARDGGGIFVVEASFPTGRMPSGSHLTDIARAQARAAGISTSLEPLGQSATEHFLVSEYRW